MQYCLRSVVVHVVRLDGPLEPYTLFEVADTGIPSNGDCSLEDNEEAKQIQDSEELDMVDDVYLI